jgi:hypothetical protein
MKSRNVLGLVMFLIFLCLTVLVLLLPTVAFDVAEVSSGGRRSLVSEPVRVMIKYGTGGLLLLIGFLLARWMMRNPEARRRPDEDPTSSREKR